MPRLTDRDFLAHRQLLVSEWWDRDGDAFFDLPSPAQRDLHDYYAPVAPFTDAEALEHRRAVTKAFPALPQKAGRAFEALRAAKTHEPNRIVEDHREATTGHFVSNGKSRTIRVAALARPSVDHAAIARMLMKLSKQDEDGKLLARAQKLASRKHR